MVNPSPYAEKIKVEQTRKKNELTQSVAELETQIEIVKGLSFGEKVNYGRIDNLLEEVMKMLNKMISNLNGQ